MSGLTEKSQAAAFGRIYLPLALVSLVSLAFVCLPLDLWVAGLFYDSGEGWRLASNGIVRGLYRFGPLPALTLGLASLGYLLGAMVWRRNRRGRRATAFIFLLILLGPGVVVNGALKGNFGRPRPLQVEAFGGQYEFHGLFVPGWDKDNCRSFPSGHASMGFALMLPYFLWRRRRPGVARAALCFGLLAGAFIGFGRIAQGGHWLSDVVWSGAIVYFTGLILEGMILVRRRVGVGQRAWEANVIMNTSIEAQGTQRPDLSIVVPFFNEEDNVVAVLREVVSLYPDAEVIAVDDGSSDATWQRIVESNCCEGLRLSRNCGQSTAIFAGLKRASGRFCGLMDGDGQNDPAGFAALLAAAKQGDADVVCGYRERREDTWSRRYASRFANALRSRLLDDGIRDTGCSMKVFAREHVDLLVLFDGLHRYLPAIFKHAGLTLAELPVGHRSRLSGESKYTNFSRGLRGAYDLIGVAWLLRRKIVLPSAQVVYGRDIVRI